MKAATWTRLYGTSHDGDHHQLVNNGHRLLRAAGLRRQQPPVWATELKLHSGCAMVMSEAAHAIPSALLVLSRDSRVLLVHCWDTGREHKTYGVVAADLDGTQPGTPMLVRRAREELGIILVPEDLTLVHVLHRRADVQRVDLFFASRVWAGEPRIANPERCDELRWVDLTNLPDDTAGHIRAALEAMHRGRLFSTLGWPATA